MMPTSSSSQVAEPAVPPAVPPYDVLAAERAYGTLGRALVAELGRLDAALPPALRLTGREIDAIARAALHAARTAPRNRRRGWLPRLLDRVRGTARPAPCLPGPEASAGARRPAIVWDGPGSGPERGPVGRALAPARRSAGPEAVRPANSNRPRGRR